jgi:hypothetical protein
MQQNIAFEAFYYPGTLPETVALGRQVRLSS